MMKVYLLLLLCVFGMVAGQHRLPPGVNPQVYQQQQQQLAMQQQQQHLAMQQQMAGQHPQQPPQHHQPPPQQHQQPPPPPPQQQQQPPPPPPQQQHQQPPPPPPQQQHQQPPPPPPQQHQQPPPPPQQPHGHGHGQQQGQVFNSQQMANERDHIGEHVGVPVDVANMSEQELQFHYFKMHDADNNNKLDGCELVKSLIHWHDQANHDPKGGMPIPEPKIFTDAELLAMIDPILEQDDRNRDGFIDYPEFIQAQQGAAAS